MNTLIQKISMTVLCASAALGAWAAVATVPSVRVEKVSEVKKTESKVYVGTVYASETVDIVARIDGVMWKSAFREGSLVKKGDLLLEVDLDKVKAAGYYIITPVLVCNTDDFASVEGLYGKDVVPGDDVIAIEK